MSYDPNELPDGWVMQFDTTHNHPFWVDTKANPPRAIWSHPYEDEQFLNDHPDVRSRIAKSGAPSEAPPPYSPRRHSFSGRSSTSSSRVGAAGRVPASQPGTPAAGSSQDAQKHRGFFGKLKDKAIGTKEEREEAKRQEALLMQQRAEQRRRYLQEMRRQQEAAMQQQRQRPSGYYSQSQPQYGYGRPVYASPAGNPFSGGYGGYGRQGVYGRGGGLGGGLGGGGVALPLIGGLAGGLLLGDLLDGGFDNGFGGGFF